MAPAAEGSCASGETQKRAAPVQPEKVLAISWVPTYFSGIDEEQVPPKALLLRAT
jgi:hypothetical protein